MNYRLAFAAALLFAALSGCAGPATSGPSSTPPATSVPSPTAVATADATPIASPQPTLEPVLTPVPSSSPACIQPTTIFELGGWGWPGMPTIDHLLACFGDTDFVVTAYIAPPEGIGGIGNGITPAWLGEWSGLPVVLSDKPFSIDGCREEFSCPWMFIFARKPALLPLTPERWVSVTGHFDDPASATCKASPGYDGEDGPGTDAEAIAICRRHFVITEIRTVPAP